MINNYEQLNNNLETIKSYVNKEQGKKEKILEQIEYSSEKLKNIQEEINLIEKVSLLLQRTSEFARNQAKSQIESLTSNCLQFIFENDTNFEIEIEELYGKANAEFYITSYIDDTLIKTKPEQSRGGGVVDIISLALRIAFLQVHKPKIQGPLILDEPAKHVSEDYILNVADFLKKTSEIFERQIIMVTHNNHLGSIGTKSYRVSMKNGESYVEEISMD